MNNEQTMLRLARRLWLSACVAAAAITALPAHALDYPTKPVTIVVPIAVGGATDGLARLLAEHLQKTWGQSVIIDSRPGASTMLGTQYVARAKPDGYTLLIALTNHLTNAAIYSKPGYDPLTSFAPITQIAASSGVIVVKPELPVANWNEFIAYSKARPHAVSHATNGNGSSSHFYAAMINESSGVDLLIVPYKGESAALTDLMGGNLDSVMISPMSYKNFGPTKKVRGLAVSGANRLPGIDLPTLRELGVPGPEAIGGWFGLLAPAGTPADIVQKIAASVREALAQPQTQARIINDFGYEPVGSTPEQFSEKLKKDLAAWKLASKKYSIQLD